jgi:hypothetical protein
MAKKSPYKSFFCVCVFFIFWKKILQVVKIRQIIYIYDKNCLG